MSVLTTAAVLVFVLGSTYVIVTAYVESYDEFKHTVDTETTPIQVISTESPLYAHLDVTIHTTKPDEPHTQWLLDNGVSHENVLLGSFSGWVSALEITDTVVEIETTANNDGFSHHQATAGGRGEKTLRINRDDITHVSYERVRTKSDIPLLTNGQPGLVIQANNITYKLAFYISDDTWRSPDNFSETWLSEIEELLTKDT